MIVSVVRNYNWSPDVIGKLYLDDEGYESLWFWYNDTKEVTKKVKNT